MKIEIYLDSLFFMNLVINMGILRLLQCKFSLGTRKIKVLLAATIGAFMYVLLFFIPLKSVWWQFGAMAISVSIMVCIILPKRKRRFWGKMVGMGFAYSFIIAGILRAVFVKWQLFTGVGTNVIIITFAVCMCVQAGMWCIRKWKRSTKSSLCSVTIESAGGCTTVTALMDTGNRLVEPLSKRPVCIMEEELLARITLENPLFLRAIPFHSVGCEQGMLYGVLVPKLIINCDEDTYIATDVICAGVRHRLSSKNAYQMILHPDLVTEESSKIMMEVKECC